jgi:hypothetical protein
MECKNYREYRQILYVLKVGPLFLVVTLRPSLQDYIKDGE